MSPFVLVLLYTCDFARLLCNLHACARLRRAIGEAQRPGSAARPSYWAWFLAVIWGDPFEAPFGLVLTRRFVALLPAVASKQLAASSLLSLPRRLLVSPFYYHSIPHTTPVFTIKIAPIVPLFKTRWELIWSLELATKRAKSVNLVGPDRIRARRAAGVALNS